MKSFQFLHHPKDVISDQTIVQPPSPVLGIIIAILLLFTGITALRYQYNRLLNTLNKKSKQKSEVYTTKQELEYLKETFISSQEEVQADIQSEMKSIRNLQKEVTDQLAELRGIASLLVQQSNVNSGKEEVKLE
mmetsp:Transcript_21518/g.28637  ORF Transcript_21518/g.28637 Transcript_21518/m.28637 type:complete len:134 (-) Transcript_21518:3-404(-)